MAGVTVSYVPLSSASLVIIIIIIIIRLVVVVVVVGRLALFSRGRVVI